MKKSNLLIGSTYALLIFFVIIYFFNFVFDDSYDASVSSMSSFQFTDFSLFDQHYLGVLVVRDLLKFIQELQPNINVFATSYILFGGFSLIYLVFTLFTIVFKNKPSLIKHFLVLALLLISIESLVSITHTRFATIIAGLALINLIYGKQSKKNILIHFSLFLFAFLVRPESGIGVILFIGLAHLIFKLNLNRLMKGGVLPILSVVLLILTFTIHKKFTNRFEILIEPDIEYALSTNRLVPIDGMKTSLDSLRYEMATAGMFIDTSFVNVKFLRTITKEQFSIDEKEIISSLQDVIYFNSYYIFFITLLFLLLLLLIKAKRIKEAFQLILYNLGVFLIFVYLDYNVDIAERHFLPLQTLVCLMNILFIYKLKINLKKTHLYPFIIVFTLMTIALFYSVKNPLDNQIQVFKDVSCLENAMEQVEAKYSNKTMVVTLNTLHLLDRRYSFYNNNYQANQYLLYDVTNYSIVPRNLKYLSKVCSCNSENPNEFLSWAIDNNVLFLIDNNRAKLMEKYMRMVHGKSITFKNDSNSSEMERPNCLQNLVYKNYEVKFVVEN